MSDTSAEVSPDERRVRLRVNGDLLVTSMSKSDSSSTGDGSFEGVKMGSVTGAGTLLTMMNTFHILQVGMHASCVEIVMLFSTVSFGASSRVVTVSL
jgi:hypothetical protein